MTRASKNSPDNDAWNFENRGRSALWNRALNDVRLSLDIARRADLASKTGAHSYQSNQSIGPTSVTPFPSSGDCSSTAQLLRDFAIIRFCAIFIGGYGKLPNVAQNPNQDSLVGVFAQYCAGKGENKNEVEKLIKSLLGYRNKILGHLDGDAFEVEHADPDPSSDDALKRIAYTTTTGPKIAPFDDNTFVQVEKLAEIGVLFSHEYKKRGLSVSGT